MTALIVISLLFMTVGGYLAWSFGMVGMSVAVLFVSFWGTFVEHSLRGFGSPTATKPPAFSVSHSLQPFLICLATTFLVYSAITLARFYLKTKDAPKIYLGIWLAVVLGGGIFYFAKESIRKNSTFSYTVTVGFDEELRLDFSNTQVTVKTKSDRHFVSFNSGGGSAVPGPYGFRLDMSGDLELQERPVEIEAIFFDGKPEIMKADPVSNHLIMYFTKNRELKVFYQ